MPRETQQGQHLNPHEGARLTPVEKQRNAIHALEVFAVDATVGSPKLIAIDDLSHLVGAQMDIDHATKSFKSNPENEENKIDLIVAKLDERKIQREMHHRDASLPGYDKVSSELIKKYNALTDAYHTGGSEHGRVDIQASNALGYIRDFALQKAQQQSQSPQK